jgi:hypothetical protein
MPQIITVPAAQVAGGKITSLAGATIGSGPSVSVSGGTYYAFATAEISGPFTPTGSAGAGGAIISGALPDQLLIAPSANFTAGNDLISLAGCYISTSLSIPGLVNDTAYRAVGLTAASPAINVASVPSAYTAGQWSVQDSGLGGTLTYTFTAAPYNGGSPITDVYIYIDGVPTSTGLAGGTGTFDVFNLTNGQEYSSRIAPVNAVGIGALSDVKVQTPVAQDLASVQDQSAPFGDRTLAGAGRFRPLDATGNPVQITAVAPVGVASGGTLIDGGLGFDVAGGGTAGHVYRLTHAGGTVDVTITKLVDHYSAATEAEIKSAVSNNGTAGGRTIVVREGTIVMSGTDLIANRTFTLPGLTLKGAGYVHDGSDSWKAELAGGIKLRNITNLTVTDLAITRTTASALASAFGTVMLYGANTNVNILRNKIQGKFNDPEVPWTSGTITGTNGIWYGTVSGVTTKWTGSIEENLIIDAINAISIVAGNEGPISISCNEFVRLASDGVKITGPSLDGPFDFNFNIARECFAIAGAHADILFQWAGIGTPATRRYCNQLNVIMNLAFYRDGLNYRGHQGACAFDDSPLGAPDSAVSRQFNDAYVVGNFVALGGNQHLTMRMNGGTCAFNTIVSPADDVITFDTTPRLLVESDSAPTASVPSVFCNIVEANQYTTPALNNLILGRNGATISYATAFGAPISTPPITYEAVKAAWEPVDAGRGAFGNVGTYGTPRIKSTWAHIPSVVEAARP